jgi:hypothetical protein
MRRRMVLHGHYFEDSRRLDIPVCERYFQFIQFNLTVLLSEKSFIARACIG